MQHRFTGQNLQGAWYKDNGRKFCAWRFDADENLLVSGRGVVVHSMQVRTLADDAESSGKLREKLPKLALELACENMNKPPVLH